MTRRSLLLGLLVAWTACTPSPSAPAPEAAGPKKASSVTVDFRFVRVVEGHPAQADLFEFIKSDGEGSEKFEGILLQQQPGPGDEVTIAGATREAIEGYLDSVFSRRPDLKPPKRFGLAFGTDPDSPGDRSTKKATRAYWLDTTSQIEVEKIRSLVVDMDDSGMRFVLLTLMPADRDAFAQLTSDAVRQKVAIVRGDEVIAAPIINDVIRDGVVVISTANTEVDALARDLRGGAASSASR